jgi:hypothetical protein
MDGADIDRGAVRITVPLKSDRSREKDTEIAKILGIRIRRRHTPY